MHLPQKPTPPAAAATACQLESTDSPCLAPWHNPALIRAHFARKILSWRAANGWSLDNLADQLGVSSSTVSLWERAKRFPNLENLVALALLMNQPPCRFYCPPPEPDLTTDVKHQLLSTKF